MKPDDQKRDHDPLKRLLHQSIAPVDPTAEPVRDLWPHVLRRLDQRPAAHWFDWALLAGVGIFAAFSPGWIPVLMYYL